MIFFYLPITEALSSEDLCRLIGYIDNITAPVTRYRSCDTKRQYESYKVAKNAKKKYHDNKAKIYHCMFCQGFHITTGNLRKGSEEHTKKIVESRDHRKKTQNKLQKPWWWDKVKDKEFKER